MKSNLAVERQARITSHVQQIGKLMAEIACNRNDPNDIPPSKQLIELNLSKAAEYRNAALRLRGCILPGDGIECQP